jgi:hypothetical protein
LSTHEKGLTQGLMMFGRRCCKVAISSSADQTPAQAPGVQRFYDSHASPVCFYL